MVIDNSQLTARDPSTRHPKFKPSNSNFFGKLPSIGTSIVSISEGIYNEKFDICLTPVAIALFSECRDDFRDKIVNGRSRIMSETNGSMTRVLIL